MNRSKHHVLAIGMFALLAAIPARAQAPRTVNTKLETRSAAAGLKRTVQASAASQSSPAWIGYAVPMIPSQREICCNNSYGEDADWDGGCGRCRLERTTDGVTMHDGGSKGAVALEGSRNILVLLRVEEKRVNRIRTFSDDCELDAGGLRLIWLTDARPAESVALLAPYARAGGEEAEHGDRLSHQALAAIALTSDASADRALENFAGPSQPERLREQTSFWLGAARGKPGYEALKRMAREDPSERVRDKVTFALSVSREPEAVEEMIRMAKMDSSSRVRGQALFWLAQKAGKKAAAAIRDAIENDSETEVKKHAVFALSQLPKDQGVPLLIQVARTNQNASVRKQAMFWLGQSNDPRALAFFEDVLAH
jgi:hypothetical protein